MNRSSMTPSDRRLRPGLPGYGSPELGTPRLRALGAFLPALSLVLGLALAAPTAISATPDAQTRDSLGSDSLASDPLEPVNRGIFAFNSAADRWVIRPLANTYSDLTPNFIQRGVGNALRNLRDVNYAINALFQGRFDDAATNAGRFAYNSTFGLAGTLDLATDAGLESSYADFGQTLAGWGVPSGPFIMIPIIGPSTVRDGAGFAVDAAVLSVPAHIDSSEVTTAIWATAVVHTRSQLLGVDSLVSGDRYIFMRDAYLQRRRTTLGGGLGLDGFGEFGEFGEGTFGDGDFGDFDDFPAEADPDDESAGGF